APCSGFAQPVDDTLNFNRPALTTDCNNQAVGGLPYPFSVSRIKNVIDYSSGRSNLVNVLIVDNNFFGYRENDDPAGRLLRVSSKNYPSEFFKSDADKNISPEIDDPNPETFIPPETDPELRHGTHIAGIVLGGMYDDNTAPAEDSLKEPSARSLLLDETGTKSWLQISFLTVQ